MGEWRNAIIIKLFDKRMGYEALMRRLKFKWGPKGSIALTDVGHAFYVVRFTNYEDYEFVMTQGPWMIGDSYLTIRKWVPNFVADEAPMRHLTAWVRIPNLSVEYFDKQVLHKIGAKIGKVIKIDGNTESMDRGQYVRFCIEVDLAKPLSSKFKLNGRIWKIQYEGLKMICFKCGHLGHKEDVCGLEVEGGELRPASVGGGVALPKVPMVGRNHKPEVQSKYGEWMIVTRPTRRGQSRSSGDHKEKVTPPSESGMNVRRVASGSPNNPSSKTASQGEVRASGSRFEVLGPESMDVAGDENVDNRQHDGTSLVDVGQVHGQDIEVGRADEPVIVERAIKEIIPGKEVAISEEKISLVKEGSYDRRISGKENMGINLEKISLYSKDKDFKKIGFRASGSSPRVNLETTSRISNPRAPKFKKGSTRKLSAIRAVGKENIPVKSLVVSKGDSVKDHNPITP